MSKICSICGEPFEGHGNNSLPFAEGKCCDSCNLLVVGMRSSLKYDVFFPSRSSGKTTKLVTKCELINLILNLKPNFPSNYLWRSKKSTLLKYYKKIKEGSK